MHKMRYIVLNKESGVDLLSEIQNSNQDQRQGDSPLFHPRQGGKHNEHKYNTACSQQRGYVVVTKIPYRVNVYNEKRPLRQPKFSFGF